MATVPPALTKKWFKANLPDDKVTKPLKTAVETVEPMLTISFSGMPGDIKMSEQKAVIDALGVVNREIEKLQGSKPFMDGAKDKHKAALVTLASACKLAKNQYLALVNERAAKEKRDASAEADMLVRAKAAAMNLDSKLKAAEAMIPTLASLVMQLVAGAADPAQAADARKRAKKAYEEANKKVFTAAGTPWETLWQRTRNEVAGYKLSDESQKTMDKQLEAMAPRVAAACKARDAILPKITPLVS